MNDPGRENELKSFDVPLKIGLAKSSDAAARIPPKSGRFQFDAASKKFKALTNPSQIELSVENLRPLAKRDCVQGRVMIIEFSKPPMQHNQLLLSELTETDKQLIHKCMLNLVGVHRGKINKTAPSGNKRPYPGQNDLNGLATTTTKIATDGNKRLYPGQSTLNVLAPTMTKTATIENKWPHYPAQSNLNVLTPTTTKTATIENKRPNYPAQNDLNGLATTKTATIEKTKILIKSPNLANRAKLSEISLNHKEEDDNVNILRPEDEFELPEKYTLNDFWMSLKKDEKIRSGMRDPAQNDLNGLAITTTKTATIEKTKILIKSPNLANRAKLSEISLNHKEEDDNVNILRPEDEVELPEKYTLNDFWMSLKKDEKIRSGMRGEWIKGQDEHLTVEGLLCLKDGEWMNADMMDAYLSFTSKRPEIQRVRYIPTYALLSYNRTKKIPSEWYWQLKEADIVLVPAHLNNNHWAMAVVDIPNRTIQMMDSMNNGFIGETKRKFMETILDILYNVAEQQNVMEYLGERGEWTRDELLDVPQQKNGTDCGIFALLFGRFSAERRPLNFDQRHIPYYRRKICYDIVATIH